MSFFVSFLVFFVAFVVMTVTRSTAEVARTKSGLAYERAGSGPVVVLIHGAFLDRRMWDVEFRALQSRATVVRYDLRGHGESPLPETAYSPVDDLFGLLDDIGAAKASLVGLSLGAQIALDAALARPDRIDRVVMAGPAISGFVERERPPFMRDLIAALQAKDYPKATEVMLATPIYAAPPQSRALVRAMMKANERLWAVNPRLIQQPAEPALKRLEQVKAPVLVLVGEHDAPGILEQAGILESRVPGVTVVRIPGGGHLLNLTSPEAFLAEVNKGLP